MINGQGNHGFEGLGFPVTRLRVMVDAVNFASSKLLSKLLKKGVL